MSVAILPTRPPYVRFEQRSEEDREASIRAGGIMMRDVDYVIVQQHGSRDTFEPKAQDWLADMRRQAAQGKIPPAWIDHFDRLYKAFKDGQGAPVHGLSVREWPSLSKAMAENCIALGMLAVEDVAEMSENTMAKLGMGARELKLKARDYLKARAGNAPVEEMAALRAENDNLKVTIESLTARLERLEKGGERRSA